MKSGWWKALGVLLLLYVVIVGLRTPLAPALVHLSEDKLPPGRNEVVVAGYNTRFTADAPQAWLQNDAQFVCATAATAERDDRLRVVFDVPDGLRRDLSHLVVRSNGRTLVFHDAFWNPAKGAGIANAGCAPPVEDTAGPFEFPDRSVLYETIRNLFFHVPMWFTMMWLMTLSLLHSIRTLRNNDLEHDRAAVSAVSTGLLFAFLGLITGSLWARNTWGTWWTSDPQLNGAAAVTLIYLAYLVLRGSVNEFDKRSRLAAIYNIFAYALMIVFFLVLPRLTDSLHPGKGGNPAFSQYDLDHHLRTVFYPAVAGWVLVGTWLYTLRRRARRIEAWLDEEPSA
ncbi:MAG: cytochrome c biogenesis protein CcsA [Flavobacteriales bacterium]|nr:cytochrome c biogenesis protein CcsA [Flavobacteriales bacterium]MCB9166637.1 cytochrome c biogenesis protein CcsA [Flavobacteriales bacterium]